MDSARRGPVVRAAPSALAKHCGAAEARSDNVPSASTNADDRETARASLSGCKQRALDCIGVARGSQITGTGWSEQRRSGAQRVASPARRLGEHSSYCLR